MIERLDRPSPETFYRGFVRRNRPVVITGVADKWEATARWSPEYFRSSFPDAKVMFTAWQSTNTSNDPTDYYRNRKRLTTRLGPFIDSMTGVEDVSRNYISQFPIFKEIPELERDIQPPYQYMKIPWHLPESLRRKLKKSPALWMGPAQIVTPIHFDAADNLLVQIYGRKKLILISPEQSKCLYYPCLRLGHVNYSPVDVEAPDFNSFPLFKDARPLEVTLEPGEILFIPVRWWHHARALERTISLNFWWFSMLSLMRMRHPYFVYQKSKILKRLESLGARV
jgi:hypothetical protein